MLKEALNLLKRPRPSCRRARGRTRPLSNDCIPIPSQIGALFGDTFAHALAGIEPGEWARPLKSAYGLHAVQVTAIRKGGLPPLEEVRAAVRREWLAEHRASALAEQYQRLRDRFQISVGYPPNLEIRP